MTKEWIVILGLAIVFAFGIVWAWDHDERFYQNCRESGGIPLRGQYQMHCMHPSAFIEMK